MNYEEFWQDFKNQNEHLSFDSNAFQHIQAKVSSKMAFYKSLLMATKSLFKWWLTDWRYGFVSLPQRFNPTQNFQRLINYTTCYGLYFIQ